MDNKSLLKARILELSHRASDDGYLTHTSFLTLSEQNLFYEILREEHIDISSHSLNGSHYIFYGGREDNDRSILFFLPYYMNEEDFYKAVDDDEIITCLMIEPKNIKFSDKLTHRDFLGALMQLGFEREVFGDILTDGTIGYVFLLKSIVNQIKEDIIKIKHTSVKIKEIKPSECPFKQEYEEKSIIVPSLRIDCIIAETFNLSRASAQELISQECVFVNGMTAKSNSLTLKEGTRISIKSKGKFIFEKIEHQTRKDKLVITIKLYK